MASARCTTAALPAPSASRFARSAARLLDAGSTKSTCSAPRDSASSPSAPEPANRSRTRAPGNHGPTMLIHASRTRSPVGRTWSPGGAVIRRPRQRPAMMRTSGAEIREPRLKTRLAVPVVPLDAKRDVDRPTRLELTDARCHPPSDGNQISLVGAHRDLQTVLSNHTWRRGHNHITSHENWRRIAHPTWLEMSQKRFQLVVDLIEGHLEIDSKFRYQILFGQSLGCDAVEAPCELRNTMRLD